MRRIPALVIAILGSFWLSACGGGDDDTPARQSSTPTSSPTPASDDQEAATPIRITFGDVQLTGTRVDNPTARDLVPQLPMTLTFRDHNSAEKTAPLPAELSTAGAPEGHDPVAGDIGYYAHGGDFVLYYDDAAPYFDGIIRIGEFRGDLTALEQQADGVRIRIERAG